MNIYNKNPLTGIAILLALPSMLTRNAISETVPGTITNTSDNSLPDYSGWLTIPDCQNGNIDSACDAGVEFHDITHKDAPVIMFNKINGRSVSSRGGNSCNVHALIYPGLVTMSISDDQKNVEYDRHRLPEGLYTLNDTRVIDNTSAEQQQERFYFHTDDYRLVDTDSDVKACTSSEDGL